MVWIHCWHTGEGALSLCWTERGILQHTVAQKNQDEHLLILKTSFPNSTQICTCTIQGHIFVIYFEGNSVQFLNQDCRQKTSEDDDYTYRDQAQIIAFFSLFYSDYHVFWCHVSFVFLMFRLLSSKILLVLIFFKPLIKIKSLNEEFFIFGKAEYNEITAFVMEQTITTVGLVQNVFFLVWDGSKDTNSCKKYNFIIFSLCITDSDKENLRRL